MAVLPFWPGLTCMVFVRKPWDPSVQLGVSGSPSHHRSSVNPIFISSTLCYLLRAISYIRFGACRGCCKIRVLKATRNLETHPKSPPGPRHGVSGLIIANPGEDRSPKDPGEDRAPPDFRIGGGL